MKKNKTIGIDYSLSSPAICICKGQFEFKNCKIYYLTNVKKYEGNFCNGQINGRLHLPYTTETQRHDQISTWALSIIGTSIHNIFIEGYSFGSKGLVFNLAENMGTLKHKLYKLNKRFQSIVPGQVKKNATGKGNADKNKMLVALALNSKEYIGSSNQAPVQPQVQQAQTTNPTPNAGGIPPWAQNK